MWRVAAEIVQAQRVRTDNRKCRLTYWLNRRLCSAPTAYEILFQQPHNTAIASRLYPAAQPDGVVVSCAHQSIPLHRRGMVRPYGLRDSMAQGLSLCNGGIFSTAPNGNLILLLQSLSNSFAARRIANNRRFSSRVRDIGTNDIINRIIECCLYLLPCFSGWVATEIGTRRN